VIARAGVTPNWERARVWLNGEEQRHVLLADSEAGWLERYVVDGAGQLQRQGDELLRERRFGHVVIAVPRT